MKLILAFLLITFSPALFAQSKKKLNVKLSNQLSVEKAKYDSLATAYNNNLSTLQSSRSLAANTLYKSLGNINYGIEAKRYTLKKELAVLQALDLKESPVVEEVYKEDLTNYYALKTSLEPLFDFHFAERKAVPPLNLTDTRKITDRNNKMTAQIQLYQSEMDSLKMDLSLISDNKAKITAFNATSDDLILEYSDELNRLVAYEARVKRVLTVAKEDYAKNGPKGFSDAYALEFPDVFPDYSSKVQKTSSTASNTSASLPAIEVPECGLLTADEKYIQAEFPGGRDSLVAFLVSNIHYPEFAFTNKITGKCYVKFLISETGKISNVKIQRGIPDCKECDEEAIRVVKAMPDWKPAQNNGKAINSWNTLPILFKVPEQK